MSVFSCLSRSVALSGASLAVGALLLAAPAMAQPVQLGPVSVNDNADKNALEPCPAHHHHADHQRAGHAADRSLWSRGEAMKEQAVTTLGDALKNVPGITIAIGEGGTLAGDQFKINGFDAKDDVYLDGLRDFGAYNRDSFDYEEVQVLKGPSGLMFGRGTGGRRHQHHLQDAVPGRQICRCISKAAMATMSAATADLNYQLSDTAAVRLNLMYTDTGVVDRDLTHSTRWGIAPSHRAGPGHRHQLHPELDSSAECRPARLRHRGGLAAQFDLCRAGQPVRRAAQQLHGPGGRS